MTARIVLSADSAQVDAAHALAQRLELPLLPAEQTEAPDCDFLLHLGGRGLSLALAGADAPGAVRADFVTGAAAYRRRSGTPELLVKALGGQGREHLVVDATAGLGRDSFMLACHGYRVLMVERSPLIAALLADALMRARAEGGDIAAIAERMQLVEGDARRVLNDLDQQPAAVYIDPMFPPSGKTAQVKKEMQLFRSLLGDDLDSEELLQQALRSARHRVVVKRARKAPALTGRSPSYWLNGKAVRFDIYALQKYPPANTEHSHE